jgi:hypothetical protein
VLVPAIDNAIMTATLSCRLIVSNLYVGLGPTDRQVDDELYVLSGGKTPFILRGTGAFSTRFGPGSHFKIIGDSYIHERMGFRRPYAKADGPWHSIYLY